MKEVHVHIHLDNGVVLKKLKRIENLILHFEQRMESKMSVLDDKIVALSADVAALSTVVDSAVALIGGIAEQIRVAVAAALAAGATDAQLEEMGALAATLEAKAAELGAAVAANT